MDVGSIDLESPLTLSVGGWINTPSKDEVQVPLHFVDRRRPHVHRKRPAKRGAGERLTTGRSKASKACLRLVSLPATLDGENADRSASQPFETNTPVANAQTECAREPPSNAFTSPSPIRAKRVNASKIRIAVSRSTRRSSIRALGLQTTSSFTRRVLSGPLHGKFPRRA